MFDERCQIADVKVPIETLTSYISHLHIAHSSIESAHLVAELLPVVVDQGVRHGLQVAGDDLVQIVQCQADTVVRDAILREVVRANPFAAVAGTDQAFSLGGPFGVLLLHF